MGDAPGGGVTARPRTVGRVRALRLIAPPLDEPPVLVVDGAHLELVRSPAGTTTASVLDDDTGDQLGMIRLYSSEHGDPFYGRRSHPDERYCYSSKLEVGPAARGRGLGRALARVIRAVAFAEDERGVTCLIGPDNAPSLRCHDQAGYSVNERLAGVRIGPRTLWLSRRAVPA